MPEEDSVSSSNTSEENSLRHRRGSVADGVNSNSNSNSTSNNKEPTKEPRSSKLKCMPRCSAPAHDSLKESPLSSNAIFHQSHAGLFNLCIVILVAVNSRLIIENLMKYGLLIRAGFWFSSKSLREWPLFMCGFVQIVSTNIGNVFLFGGEIKNTLQDSRMGHGYSTFLHLHDVNSLSCLHHIEVNVVNNINRSIGNTAVGEQEHVLYGSSTITECINGLVFEISANSFFQTNPRQAEILYNLVAEAACLEGNGEEIILDLFCGTGTIGLTLADRVKHVYGYEIVPEAVADARRNAARNGIKNATFVQGDLNKIPKAFGDQFPLPDVVIIDPNRPGLHTDLIKCLLKLKPKRIVYVSCNPATCAQDLDYLAHGLPGTDIQRSYRLLSVQPVDMFPHTPHIECVCSLELL